MKKQMRTPVFQEENGSWKHLTKTVNPLTYTIEYSCITGFSSMEEAEESYQNSLASYQEQLARLKKTRNMPFTFSEYLDYWFHEIYTPSSTSGSTRVKYQWVLYQIILPNLQEDILLGCVKTEFLNKLLASCQRYCRNGGYYAYKLLNVILASAYEHNYIPEGEAFLLKSFPEPKRKAVIFSQDQIRKLLSGACQTNSYFEILLALFCGLTKGEILGLKYSDFKRNKHTLTIQRTCSRSKSDPGEVVLTSLFGTARNRTLKIPHFISQELFNKCSKNSPTSSGGEMNCTSEHICSKNLMTYKENTCSVCLDVVY